MKTKIYATTSRKNPGDLLMDPRGHGRMMRVIRSLTGEEIDVDAKKFVEAHAAGAEIHWCEAKVAPSN